VISYGKTLLAPKEMNHFKGIVRSRTPNTIDPLAVIIIILPVVDFSALLYLTRDSL